LLLCKRNASLLAGRLAGFVEYPFCFIEGFIIIFIDKRSCKLFQYSGQVWELNKIARLQFRNKVFLGFAGSHATPLFG
jgi:hypothetical protein